MGSYVVLYNTYSRISFEKNNMIVYNLCYIQYIFYHIYRLFTLGKTKQFTIVELLVSAGLI